MKKISQQLSKNLLFGIRYDFSSHGDNVSFLKMVESYFDKAGKHTNIRPDKLNFYKKPDNLVKFTLTLTRAKQIIT